MPKKRDITSHQRTRRWHDGVTAINAAADAPGIVIALAAHGKKLDLDMTTYNGLTEANKAIVDAAVLAGKAVEDYVGRNAVAAVFGTILLARVAAQFAVDMVNAALSEVKMDAVIVQYAEVLGLELDDYNLLTDDNKETVCEDMLTGKPYENEAAIKVAFDAVVATELEAQALVEINAATADTMGLIITAYADALGLDLTDYSALEEAKKGEVHTAMVAGQTYADKGAVKTAFDAAVLAAQGE